MFLLQKATEVTSSSLRERVGERVTERALRELYAYPDDADDLCLRANMISSLDGSATSGGRSGGLGGPGDRLIFGILRELADAILVGARTAIDEGYHVPATHPDGRRPALVLASRSLDLPESFATAVDPGTLIATCADAPADRRARLVERGATLINCGTDTVEPRLVRGALADRGHRRVLCEGGPRLLADFFTAGAVDELALTTAPLLVGGDGPRIAHGATPTTPLRATLRHRIADDDGYQYDLWRTD